MSRKVGAIQLPGISRQDYSGWLAAADLLRSEGLVDVAEHRRGRAEERQGALLWLPLVGIQTGYP